MAIGNSKAGLVYQYGAFRRQAPALLGSRAAYSTDWNATNRLLVGPFASESAARAFAAQLGARGVQAHSWTSEAGQEIDALQGANDSRTTRTRTAASEQRPAAGSRTARSRAGQRQRPSAASGATRSGRSASTRAQSGRSQSGRAPSTRAQAGAKPKPAAAGASRGRSQPQSRPSARRRRSR
jgi:sporulation related protein